MNSDTHFMSSNGYKNKYKQLTKEYYRDLWEEHGRTERYLILVTTHCEATMEMCHTITKWEQTVGRTFKIIQYCHKHKKKHWMGKVKNMR